MIDDFRGPARPKNAALDPTVIAPTQAPEEPMFQPPEAMANIEEEPAVVQETFDVPDSVKQEHRSKFPFHFNLHPSKKTVIIASVVGVIVLAGGGAGAFALLHKPKKAPVVAQTPAKVETKPAPAPAPTTLPSPLTGVQVKPEQTKLPVTGVMIENSPDARPQSGLKDAGVVYEAIAEGGITRFLALFQQSDQPDYIGPVRSARPYYLEWLQGYDAAIAHVGGSPEALNLIKAASIKDLDQFYNSGSYHRISQRYAPHNVYTSINELLDLQKTKGYTSSTFTGFTRKGEKASAAPNATSLDFTMSGYLYNVHYDYDAASNSYKRSEGSKPHLDERSGAQLSPKVVVAIVVPYGIQSDGLHSDYQTTGSGEAFVFQDGVLTKGNWTKKGSKDPLALTDASGAPLPLDAGQTWITAVGTAGSVAVK